ncbi:AAA family ATPase [Candidatus Woesearchaeota archaeon]|nr:AAA family ATPase [Candidatus Woesearchaeota archaeon]
MRNYKQVFDEIVKEAGKVIVGQEQVIEQILVAILCDGNALLEGYPGLAKTLTVRTLSQLMDLKFSRIQNTPDLMPSDITGTYIIEETSGKRQFKFQPGPIFANVVLADEINRATPKTQSALLEAMQEKQVTVGTNTFKLDLPFFVLATQNPIEQEGSLALSQSVFINGQLKTGKELLAMAEGKCIAEDEKGIKLYEIGSWTFSLNASGKLERQKCLLYTLPYNDDIAVITTKTGKKISVTKNHPFLVNDDGIIAWKKAEDLTKQDFLVNPSRLPSFEQKVMLHEDAVSRMLCKPIPKEMPFDEDFAFWIGFLLSDGSIGTKYVEAVQKNYPEALDRFVEISKKYGFSPRVSVNRGCRYARIYSKPLVEYLNIRFGIEGGKDKEIPPWFLSMPAEMNREFLRTFISLESSIEDGRITFTQKSAKNMSIISYMLLREEIVSWIRHDGKIFRMKIQGKDFITFVKNIGWVSKEKLSGINLERTTKSSFRVVPVDRKAVLRLVEILGLNSFHTLKGRKSITSRAWYGSYKGVKEGETVMSVDALKKFASDIRNELSIRKSPEYAALVNTEQRKFAAGFGIPMTEISRQLNVSHNVVWRIYANGASSASSSSSASMQMKEFLIQKHEEVVKEAESLLNYCEALLSEDIYYDRIKSIEYAGSDGMAFGLTVPRLQNYIAGFGGCGINHNTYPLPEAQSDRFLLKIKVAYPTYEQELQITDRFAAEFKDTRLKVLLNKNHLLTLQGLTRQVPIANDIKQRAVKIIMATRANKEIIQYGASPRASIGLILASKARALVQGRNHVSNDDLNLLAYPILRHRIILNFEAERKGIAIDDAVKAILDKVK